MSIEQNVSRILGELPDGVRLVAAAKARDPREVIRAIEAGVEIVGENYVQEAERAYKLISDKAEWHFIGHLQKNKVARAVKIFDMIETVDSVEIAAEIDKRCARLGKKMPVLIEVNSGREKQKTGVFPEDAEGLIREISTLEAIKVSGLMTMGPLAENPDDLRPYFSETKRIFDKIGGLHLPGVEMRYLSMGMTGSYAVALEEGANMIRLGTRIFGERDYQENPGRD